jgi:transposase
MPSHTFHLSPDELAQLEAAMNDPREKVQRRAKALYMVHQEYSFDVITVNASHRSLIYHWIERWNVDGIASLTQTAKRSGRPPVTDASYRELLVEVLSSNPEACGYFETGWTVGMLNHIGLDPV